MKVTLDELDALIAKYVAAESSRTHRSADAAYELIMASRITSSNDEDRPHGRARC